MAQDQKRLTDDELLELFNSGGDLKVLVPDDQQRLLRLVVKDEPPPEEPADFKSEVVGERGDDWTDWLPTAMATGASFLGGTKVSPIGSGLAFLGGAAGEATKEIADVLRGDMSEVPSTPIHQLMKIYGEGATQAGWDYLGGKAMKLAKRPAKALYEHALKPGLADVRNIGGRDILEGGEQLAETAIDNWLLPATKGSSRRAGRAATRSAQRARNMAQQSPQKVDVSDFASQVEKDQLDKAAERISKSGATTNTAPMQKQVAEFVAQQPVQVPRPHTMTPAQLRAVTQFNQKEAGPAFRAAKGQFYVPPPELGSGLSVSKSIADVGKRNLDSMLGEAFTAANKNTSTLTGLKDAIAAGARRSGQGSNLFATGAGAAAAAASGGNVRNAAIAAALAKLLTNPNAQGAAAIGLSKKQPYSALFSGLDAAGVTPDVRALFSQLGQDEEE